MVGREIVPTGRPLLAVGLAFVEGASALLLAAGRAVRYPGDYFFADFCSGWIRVRDAATGRVSPFASGLRYPVDLQTGPDGALYVLARGTGSVTATTAGEVRAR